METAQLWETGSYIPPLPILKLYSTVRQSIIFRLKYTVFFLVSCGAKSGSNIIQVISLCTGGPVGSVGVPGSGVQLPMVD